MTECNDLRLREKVGYGVGDFASCLYWASFGHFLFKFYTDVFGISAAVAGAIFLWSRIWDAVNDPILGSLADRTRSRWGKFRPWILFGAVPFAVSGVLAFTTPNLSPTGKVVWAIATYNLVMMMYTVVNIPYSALLGVITPNSMQRTGLSSIRFVCAFLAGLFVKTTLPAMTQSIGGGDLRLGFQLTFVVYGLIAVGLFMITFWSTRERVQAPVEQDFRLGRDLRDLFCCRPWLILLAVQLPFVFYAALRGTITAHYFDYFVGSQTISLPLFGERTYGYSQFFGAFHFVGYAGSLIGVVGVTAVARWMGKRSAFLLLLGISIAATAAVHLLRPQDVMIIIGLNFVSSITGAPLSVLIWAMMADTADYAEWRTGRRSTGLVFSAQSLTGKFSWALAGYYAGRALQATGYVPNVPQTPEVLEGMRAMMSLLPAGAGLIALAVMLFYPLGEARVRQIEGELRARREHQPCESLAGTPGRG